MADGWCVMYTTPFAHLGASPLLHASRRGTGGSMPDMSWVWLQADPAPYKNISAFLER